MSAPDQRRLPRGSVFAFAFAVAFVQLQCLLVPEDEKGHPVANKPPVVRITSGVPTDNPDGINYRALFRWNGIDDDGEIVRYQWTTDAEPSETAWNNTTELSTLIYFEATTQDQDDPESGIFNDWHRFSVRAIDNESAVSRPDVQFFNAETIAPTSEITFPNPTSRAPELNSSLNFSWEGEDLDSSLPGRRPVAWEVKLVRIHRTYDSDEVIADSLILANNMLLDSLHVGPGTDWLRLPYEESIRRVRDLPGRARLAFAVRAVDEAGAVEPFLERGRNVLAFSVREQPGQPSVMITEAMSGRHIFPNDGPTWEVSVPTNRELYFRWTGDSRHYGSFPEDSNYALDIPDVENDSLSARDGIGGWIGWKQRTGTDVPIRFGAEEAETHHVLWVRMRDLTRDKASERLCRINIHVVPFTFEHFALIVDDAKFATQVPADASHDAFLQETITARFHELGDVDHLILYPGLGGIAERTNPIHVDLGMLSRYQHIFWSLQVGTGNPQALRVIETEDGLLSKYAGAGGRLFFGGGRISSFMLGGPNGTFAYPKNPPLLGDPDPDFEADSFIWKFMKYRDTIVSVPTNGSSLQAQASGLIALRSQHPAYPDLQLDETKRSPFAPNGNRFRGGIRDWEGVQPRSRPREDLAGFEALYTPVTMDTTLCCGRVPAGFDDAIVAHRYESTAADSLTGTQQGRTMIFNFQPYWFEAESLKDAGTAAINWLVTGHDR